MQVPSLPPGPSYASITNNGGFPAPTTFVRTTRAPEPQTNPFAGYPVLARRWSNGMQQHLCEGDLLFVKAKGSSGQSCASSRAPMTVVNLQQLNAALASGVAADQRNQRIGDASDWRFFGVLNNDATRAGHEKLVNAIVRGRTQRVTNVWPNSRVGDKVGFALGNTAGGKFSYADAPYDDDGVFELKHWMPADFKAKYLAGGVEKDVAKKQWSNFMKRDGVDALYNTLGTATTEEARRPIENQLRTKWAEFCNAPGPPSKGAIWVPVNFTQLANKHGAAVVANAAGHMQPGRVINVGVIGDMFSAAPSEAQAARHVTQMPGSGDVAPGMSAWDPQCELFVRVG